MQKKQWRPFTDDRDGEWIITGKVGKVPPLQLVRQSTGLRIEQTGAELTKQGFQEGSGLGSAAPTRASSKAPGVTAKGRWCRSEPSRQAKEHTC